MHNNNVQKNQFTQRRRAFLPMEGAINSVLDASATSDANGFTKPQPQKNER
ncbi:hypothetical protein [Paracidovorax valerianellae]|uniref:Uncharacterized protein n=1 Tax=Paracidovorax valerianellae TaxID=187868 RepID=A0A1G6JPM2_9BURK|nr:hypothetical protein [Paracidovorax valerianellae]MDA8445306.1 hypothetical protein [Paracidovorax valerianellae]SDC20653.1 hypothetical protein SAMN05192589_101453 [Paracidovorax valerianellae]